MPARPEDHRSASRAVRCPTEEKDFEIPGSRGRGGENPTRAFKVLRRKQRRQISTLQVGEGPGAPGTERLTLATRKSGLTGEAIASPQAFTFATSPGLHHPPNGRSKNPERTALPESPQPGCPFPPLPRRLRNHGRSRGGEHADTRGVPSGRRKPRASLGETRGAGASDAGDRARSRLPTAGSSRSAAFPAQGSAGAGGTMPAKPPKPEGRGARAGGGSAAAKPPGSPLPPRQHQERRLPRGCASPDLHSRPL